MSIEEKVIPRAQNPIQKGIGTLELGDRGDLHKEDSPGGERTGTFEEKQPHGGRG